MQVDLYNKDGQQVGKTELPEEIFGIEPNENAMHQAVVVYLAHQRQGTRKTKTRAEVSGGGKKPWRQKGRGTARSGSSRSPVWVHGGTVHGPKPCEFNLKIQKKLSRLARKSAFSLRNQENSILIVDDFMLNDVKTKSFYTVLKNLKLDKTKTLVLLPEANETMFLSARNIENISIYPASQVSTYDILCHKQLVIFNSALKAIENTFGNN